MSPIQPLIDLAINSFITFFVIIDPIGLIGIFNGLAVRMTPHDKRRLAIRGITVGSGILVLFSIGGERLLGALGISLPAFRAAGGAMLFMLAIEMMFQHRHERRRETAENVADEPPKDDVAIFPLGIPLIAGPGAITSALLLTSRHKGDMIEQGIVLVAMLAVLAITLVTFLVAERLGRVIGPTLVAITTRLLGILLAAVAVEYMVVGVRQIWDAAR
ncbi:MAG: MarC family transcriptional regulator [Rhodospirillales bacterium]|nr:MarC family transcriptional regulator [Rhodospirillales bacterium]